MPHEIHEVGRILAVMDRESRVESNLGRVFTQQPRTDGVKRAGPSQGVRHYPGLWS